MHWLRKKLMRKFVVEMLALGGASILAVWKFPDYALYIMGGLVLMAMVLFWRQVSHPLNKILWQFKALLTGKAYNRLYTEKIDEVGILAHFFNETTHSLERVTTDLKERRRLSSELNLARKIQQDLLPKTMPVLPGLKITAKTRPAAEIGGDAFDFLTRDGQTFFYLGDATGHGVPSGLIMMVANTLLTTFVDISKNTKDILVQTNKYLKPRIQKTMFMTLVMFRWVHATQELFYTGAGHETIIHYHAATGKCDNIPSGGIALAMLADNEKLMVEKSLKLEPGDFLVTYSDGIVEGRNPEGELYGIERLVALVEQEAPQAKDADDLFERISKNVLGFLGDFIQLDDMSLMVMQKI